MKLFKYTCGDHEAYAPAEDQADAFDRREEVNPSFHYLPVVVEEMKLEGYEITVKPLGDETPRRGRKTGG